MSNAEATLKSWKMLPLTNWEEFSLISVASISISASRKLINRRLTDIEAIEGIKASLIGTQVWVEILKNHGNHVSPLLEVVLREKMAEYVVDKFRAKIGL